MGGGRKGQEPKGLEQEERPRCGCQEPQGPGAEGGTQMLGGQGACRAGGSRRTKPKTQWPEQPDVKDNRSSHKMDLVRKPWSHTHGLETCEKLGSPVPREAVEPVDVAAHRCKRRTTRAPSPTAEASPRQRTWALRSPPITRVKSQHSLSREKVTAPQSSGEPRWQTDQEQRGAHVGFGSQVLEQGAGS